MKGIAILAATAAMLSLAGCNRIGVGTNMSANAATGNATAAKPADAAANQAAAQSADAGKLNAGGGAVPASSSGTVTLDRAYMMGRWTDDNDCSNVIEFNQDGGFVAANGGTGLWNLDGDRLTMTGRDTATIRISPIDRTR